jgi:hypothetical protein
MPVIIQTTDTEGTVTNVVQPMTAAETKAELSTIWKARKNNGISVGELRIATTVESMAVWQGMWDNFNSEYQEESYACETLGGDNVTIEPWEVARVYQCFAWYIAACLGTQGYFQGLINAAQNQATLNAIYFAMASDASWPQTQFAWQVSQPVAAFDPSNPSGDVA